MARRVLAGLVIFFFISAKKYDLGVKKNRPDKRVLLSILT